MAKIKLDDEMFGPLLPYIKDDSITDVNFNGLDLWVDDLKLGRYKVENFTLSEQFLNNFCVRLGNIQNANFNRHHPVLEADTESLRISCVHESVTNTGKSISIRKTPAVKRLNRKKIIDDKYCEELLDIFMEHAIHAGLSMVIVGLPGSGKTEYLKHLTSYIPGKEKVITIEDNFEIRYRNINPGKDCVEMGVTDNFSYTDAIKTCLRQLPVWILLSEARSIEVKYLLESMSTGTHCLTTLHTDDVRKIPDRIYNMIREDVRNDIFAFIDVGIYIMKEETPEGIQRKISQVCFFTREDGENRTTMFYENGEFKLDLNMAALPKDIQWKMKQKKISNPFKQQNADKK